MKAVAVKEKISDEIKVGYQSTSWGQPAKLALTELDRKDGVVTLQAKIFDAKGVACLDAATLVRFDKLGDAQLLDNLGTSIGSRAVQLYNGRAIIQAKMLGTQAVFSLSSSGLETQYLTLKK